MHDSQPELDREWLLTNGLGGYAMGTACGAATRRYHGLLVGATNPPVNRVVALHSTVEAVSLPGTLDIPLSTHVFGNEKHLHPDGWHSLLDFDCDGRTATWRWQLPSGITVVRTLRMRRGFNACTIRWKVDGLPEKAWLKITPLVLLRDFHLLQTEPTEAIRITSRGRTLRAERNGQTLSLRASRGAWHGEPDWWHRFNYPIDARRGYDHEESSLAASTLDVELTAGMPTLELAAEMDAFVPPAPTPPHTGHATGTLGRLGIAADQFVVARGRRPLTATEPDIDHVPDRVERTSIIAGYPWFADWGRDAMIALPGLLITTGRLDEARCVLETFAEARRDGLLPNRFDDRHDAQAFYNTADAGLWFLHALHAWIEAAGGPGKAPDCGDLIAAAFDIVGLTRAGRTPGMRIDTDGLVEAGIPGEALTWMDARIDGVPVTPRDGKPVELSALWQSGLRLLADVIETPAERRRLTGWADEASASFDVFWNERLQCCSDRLIRQGDAWRGDPAIRPNQLFAVSLPFSPLTPRRQHSVMRVVRHHLLTPFGLRTLSPNDPVYRGRYEGDMASRDHAYHNGTVWPWLLGPWCDALHATGDDPEQEIRSALSSLVASLDTGCVGQLAEIHDGDAPHDPHGCPAQAWSVAEILRSLATANQSVVRPQP